MSRLTIYLLTFLVAFVANVNAQEAKTDVQGASAADNEGKQLFITKCQACHSGDMKTNSTGPALFGVVDKWTDKAKLHEWVRNNTKLIASGYPQAVEASKFSATVMQTFPDITDAQIDAIFTYVQDKGSGKLDVATTPKGAVGNGIPQGSAEQNKIIFGVISLILGLVALVMLYLNRNLKRVISEVDGVPVVPELPVYRNKVFLATASIIFFVIGGYLITKGLINTNRQVSYQPTQPIFYSHKVHAGINQINCLYCHGNAWESKTAAIPSVNVCMNCHKTIQKYNGPELHDASGSLVDGTAEIAKLYKYAGFDPMKPDDWDASKATPIEWVKIHNLPDHVYFNHSQHVKVGNVQCQTCHGEITAMDEVKQVSELSMGWCVNCHRQTAVNFNTDSTKGNKYYSIYEKFHDDIKSGKMDSVTVKDIGGLECQKCHY